MAQVDKIKVGSTTYDIANATSATLAFTSSDVADGSATAWTSVSKLTSGETYASMFAKISQMFKNIRYVYAQLGTKASSSHTHAGTDITSGTVAAARLPLSSSQTNSTSYAPTSSLVYSMNTTLTSLNNAIGCIKSNAANNRYEEVNLGTWKSLSQVNTFLSTYTHNNGYKSGNSILSCGNYVTIQDGTYNAVWMIAGFDTEYNRGDTASGYGITMIPRTYVTTAAMNDSHTTAGGYYGSKMHTTTLPAIATALQTVLGTHLQSRRVLLSNSVDTASVAPGCTSWTGVSNGWVWYSAYCTLMSEVQVYGSSVWGGGFDVGEACQKLPVFNFINHNQFGRKNFWLRAVASSTCFAHADSGGSAHFHDAGSVFCVRPLIYLS